MGNGLVSAQGEALTTADKGQRPHNPEQVDRLRAQLSKALAEIKQTYLQDIHVDEVGATTPNEPAARAFAIEKWDERCRIAAKSDLPIILEHDAMRTWFAQRDEKAARDARFTTPLHKLAGLEEYDFAKVGETRFGTVWMNNQLVVVVATNGEVRIFLKKYLHPTDLLSTIEAGYPFTLTPEPAVNYTAKELFNLLKALRITAVAAPLEHDLAEARVGHADTADNADPR